MPYCAAAPRACPPSRRSCISFPGIPESISPQGLGDLSDTAGPNSRTVRGGRYRMWRVEHETHAIDDGVESMRNFLGGSDFDAAVDAAFELINAFRNFRQSRAVAAVAAEILES